MKKLRNSMLLLLSLSLIITATVNLSPVFASPTALRVLPESIIGYEYAPLTWFTVNVTVEDVTGLAGFEFKLGYVNTVLNAMSITLGDFFPRPIGPAPDGPSIIWHEEMNNDLGYVFYAVTLGRLSPDYAGGKSGSGTLATINFTVTGWGGTILDLYDTVLCSPNAEYINHEVYFGIFNNQKEPPHVIFTASTYIEEIKKTIEFDAHLTHDHDPPGEGGTIVSYYWDFGDGTTETSVDNLGSPTPYTDHSYEFVGTYTVSLTVTDDMGAQGRAEVTIKVIPPTAAKAAVVEAEPAYRHIRVSGKEYGINFFSLNPFYVDVQNLCGSSLRVKVGFTIKRDGATVDYFETSPYTFEEGTYLSIHRFDTSKESPPEYETHEIPGKYMVTAQCLYSTDGGTYAAGNIRSFGFRVSP